MRTALVEQRLTEIWETSKSLSGKLSSVDHKKTGVRYVVTAVVLPCAMGVEALILRIQLASPDQLILTPAIYDHMSLVCGFTIFWCGSPIVSDFRERARCGADSGQVPCGCGMHEPAGCSALPGDCSRRCAHGPAKHRSQRLRRVPRHHSPHLYTAQSGRAAALFLQPQNHNRGQAAEFAREPGPLTRKPAICRICADMPGLGLTNDQAHEITAYLHTLR
jgi:hypothetical protein